MLGKLLPIVLAVVGVGAGIGAGIALRPDPAMEAAANPCGDIEAKMAKAEPRVASEKDKDETRHEYVKLNNQFVIPVVGKTLVNALVVMALTVEVAPGKASEIYTREPKLRDAFLQVLFDHANMGGFEGEFTNAQNLDVLRVALTETAQAMIGTVVTGVLITDIARQDV